jgi:hypothetical protein
MIPSNSEASIVVAVVAPLLGGLDKVLCARIIILGIRSIEWNSHGVLLTRPVELTEGPQTKLKIFPSSSWMKPSQPSAVQ